MNEPRRKVRTLYAFFLAVWAGLFAAPTGAAPAAPAGWEKGGECLVLIDLDAFYCGLCLEALLSFCRAVPAAVQESRVRAVLLLRPASAAVSDADLVRIALKKWDGFRRANGIRFPVLCDEGRAFRLPDNAASAVLLLDGAGRTVRTLPLPLKPKELAGVLRFLAQSTAAGAPGLPGGPFPPYSPVVKSHGRVASRRLAP
jgi:hypothetical protein